MRSLPSGPTRSPVGTLTWLTLCAWLVYGCDTPAAPLPPDSSCSGEDCDEPLETAIPRFPVDWGLEHPTYDGLFQIVDEAGAPVPGATLLGAGHSLKTGGDGHVRLANLMVTRKMVLRIEHPDYMPTLVKASYDSAGRKRQTITLLEMAAAYEVNADVPVTLREDGLLWQFERNPFVRSNGQRVHGRVQVRMMSVPPGAVPESALPADDVATGRDGKLSLIGEHVGLIYVQAESLDGDAVRFAPGASARMSLRLPRATRERIRAGIQLGLFTLDADEARWARESSCNVEEMADGSGDLACTGHVGRFGHWLVARERDDYTPEAFGCVNMYVDTSALRRIVGRADDGNRWAVNLPLKRCDPDTGACTRDRTFSRGLRAHVKAPDGAFPAACGIAPAGETYRFDAQVLTAGEDEAHAIGTRFELRSLRDMDADDDTGRRLLEGGFDPDRDCGRVCQQVVIRAQETDLRLTGVDADRDGYFTGGFGSSDDEGERDCDDTDPRSYPGAPEPPCRGRDRNCDGYASQSSDRISLSTADAKSCTLEPARATQQTPVCASVWNRMCTASCFSLGDEIRHNAYDEDCDGRATDRDGDGFESPRDGEGASSGDCDDDDPNTHPGAEEVPGNALDENCDGVRLDADGDGFFAGHHAAVATAMGLTDNADLELMFGDCDDDDAGVHPMISREEEAGQLSDLFVYDEGVPVRRLASYCGFFGLRGDPTPLFYRNVRDLNCDGTVTDVDGDGLLSPDDPALADGAEADCDDFDPRIGGASDCAAIELSGLENEVRCDTEGRARARRMSPDGCPLLAASTQSQCVATDGGEGLCIYPGWESADPLRFIPGALWGPCDGRGRVLADCPDNAICGAPVAYSRELVSYLETHYTDGEALEFQGMCFQACGE